MSRRSRRARRRLRRGDTRREPLLLYTDDAYPGESLEHLARWIYRYRSELAPLAVTGALALIGAVLHARHPDAAPLVAVLGVTVAGLLTWPKAAPDLRRIERLYAVTLTATAALWLTLATAYGPDAGVLRPALIVAAVVGAVPWWAHRRRRAKVRVERTLDAWPDIAENVGLPGSRVMSAVIDAWGWRARIRLRRGQTAADVVNRGPALESGLGTRPGALRVEPDPDRADRVTIRVLDADPHAHAIPYPTTEQTNEERPSITDPVPLGLFEDARPVSVVLAHRHTLVGGLAGSGKSGVLNAILARLVACPDVVLWGIDLKGGMEFGPWSACLDRLATTPTEATQLLGEAVAVLNTRATRMATNGERLWRPSPSQPALIVIVDEYAELSEYSVALVHADSIARRGRAVAVTLLAATQRPTQKAMGAGAVRSQMDVRLCLRVRERRDVDLILGQGMLTSGWHAHTLDAPGKFLISAPEHPTPRPARAYLLTDADVQAIAYRWTKHRPILDTPSQNAADDQAASLTATPTASLPKPRSGDAADIKPSEPKRQAESASDSDPEAAFWIALSLAPANGSTIPELMTATGMSRSWIYYRLQEHAGAGRADQVSRGRWRTSSANDRDDMT